MLQTALICATVCLWLAAFALMFSNNDKKREIIEEHKKEIEKK